MAGAFLSSEWRIRSPFTPIEYQISARLQLIDAFPFDALKEGTMSGPVEPADQATIGSSVAAAQPESEYLGVSVDPLAQPFDGWIALADVVSDTSPTLADLMVALSDAARIAVEDQIPGLVESLMNRFGLSSAGYEGTVAELRANAIPLNAETAVRNLAASYALLSDEQTDIAEGIAESENGLADAVISEFRKTARLDEGDELFNTTLDAVKELYGTPQVLLEASCSLEQPSGLGVSPIYCAHLAHPNMKDRITAAEYTYGTSIESSFDGNIEHEGSVVHRGYRPDINEPHLQYFWSTIAPPVRSWAYTLHLNEGPKFRLRSMASAQEILMAHRDDIGKAVQSAVKNSSDRIEGLAKPTLQSLMGVAGAAAAIPFIHTLIPLAAAAAAAVVKFIVDKIVKATNGGNLTTWTIGHTVVTGSEWVPLSIFTLAHSGPPGLCRLTFDTTGKPQASDYAVYPDEFRRARFMLGWTNDPKAQFDPAYFGLVAKTGRPLAWREPWEDKSGFRILLPHTRIGSGAMYVTAVRADVRLGTLVPPPLVYER